MKRIQMFLAGAFIAAGSLYAQSGPDDWKADVAKLKETVQTNPAQAKTDAALLTKGKNKKNVEFLVAVGRIFLDAGEIDKAQEYAKMALSANSHSDAAFVLDGDVAVAKKDGGRAGTDYEMAINYNPNCREAYLKYADIYKAVNYELSVEKLEQLKEIDPSNVDADRKLAEIYYSRNDFDKSAEAYARVIRDENTSVNENDLVRYAFALFLNHDFEKSLEVANIGLQKNARHPVFNRLAMYNYVDLKRLDEALKASELFFNETDKADYSYLDYMYYGHLLEDLEKYEDAVVQYEKAMELDSTNMDLYKNISSIYEQTGNYKKSIDAFRKYYLSLTEERQTPDLLLQLGRLYYSEGTQSDSLAVFPEERRAALMSADSVFQKLAEAAPESHLGNLWRARTNSALDPETSEGLAKPFYESIAALLEGKNEARYDRTLIECYKYLGYYYLLAAENPDLKSEMEVNKDKSKEYWNKILIKDPADVVATNALEGLK